MERWLRFEHLVARIHEAVDGDYYTVEHDVTLIEPGSGKATAQIDILLRPRSPFLGPILISCKSSGERVGVDHVREWSDVVAHAGAAAGVIVSPTGFTAGAIDTAKDPTRRLSLWLPRRFTDADYAADDDSPNGYLRSIHTTFQVRMVQPDVESFRMEVEPASGRYEGIIIESRFAADTRDRYYLRDGSDSVSPPTSAGTTCTGITGDQGPTRWRGDGSSPWQRGPATSASPSGLRGGVRVP